MKYRLYELNPEQFEELCSEICLKILGAGLINFASGKDGGKDGKFSGKANSFPSEKKTFEGKFIIQAKHTTNVCASCSNNEFKNIVKKEIPKIEKLYKKGELEHYFLLTNRKLSGGYEAEFQKQINKNIPSITSVSIWGKERIHIFLDNNRHLHKKFGFNSFRSPLNIRPEDLEKVIKGFRDFVPSTKVKDRKKAGKDFNYIKIDRKNLINRLSDEYYQHIKEDSEKDFIYIEEFLQNPRNEKYRKLYNDTAYDFKGVIISERDNFVKFDEILEEIFSESYSKWKEGTVDKRLLKMFIHFMYFSCDIGQKEG